MLFHRAPANCQLGVGLDLHHPRHSAKRHIRVVGQDGVDQTAALFRILQVDPDLTNPTGRPLSHIHLPYSMQTTMSAPGAPRAAPSHGLPTLSRDLRLT